MIHAPLDKKNRSFYVFLGGTQRNICIDLLVVIFWSSIVGYCRYEG